MIDIWQLLVGIVNIKKQKSDIIFNDILNIYIFNILSKEFEKVKIRKYFKLSHI